ncbi:MAG: WGR domain-containing protein [Gammaproteobacteria bacterium]|nr:WGR domain-containing protein [Gammaproteobacteria bacterium]
MWRWINPYNHRYYQADLVQDLFGDGTLVCAWGGYGTPYGNHTITGVASHADGLRKIDALGAHRKKRGYIPVSSFGGWASQIAAMKKKAYSPPEKLIQSSDIPETAFFLE